ncbi:GNAT family N-acetyltransferase [Colwellia psychrerythraea]|uniref:BioF2-like acetyltransferase domain-containing protein n=1 Tax=Colwellia psychrerythraea TaxID=28229 RepID=A0A099L3R1_COLPS|nr:GNAT family N-acetyltransferase [Colwellia psychrerythraea]KGJ96792.1 hypothetical protein GAB14E_1668 [Colwellia psychrerythraea]
MKTYNINFQIGDIVLFSHTIQISTVTKNNLFLSEPADALPEDDVPLPHYLPQLSITPELTIKKITAKEDKLFYVRSIYNNFFINLNEYSSFDEYLSKFSAKSRSTLKRKVRKAEKSGFTCKIYESIEEVDDFHQQACEVGEKTYQNRLFNSSIPNDRNYLEKMKTLALTGNLLGLILFKDDEACAYLYLPIENNEYIYAYLGYLKGLSKFSPGTVLQFYAFEKIFNQKPKATYFNFTEGDGKHKEFFATDKKTCCNCLIIEKSISAMILLYGQLAFDSFSTFIGQILDKYDLRAKIKKLIRQR